MVGGTLYMGETRTSKSPKQPPFTWNPQNIINTNFHPKESQQFLFSTKPPLTPSAAKNYNHTTYASTIIT